MRLVEPQSCHQNPSPLDVHLVSKPTVFYMFVNKIVYLNVLDVLIFYNIEDTQKHCILYFGLCDTLINSNFNM